MRKESRFSGEHKDMVRKIIRIDGEKCNGCGACARACHEGAIEMIDGVATLTREDYCDGLGDCLPACPTGAITFEEREAPAYNEEAVLAAKAASADEKKETPVPRACPGHGHGGGHHGGGCTDNAPHGHCPGSRAKAIRREESSPTAVSAQSIPSQLLQWPCQIKLVPVRAPYFDGANLLVAADCTAYAYGNFHADFMKNHITLIGCPKLDEGDYAEKLSQIIENNNIKSVKILRMEVPCCGGLENAVKRALMASGKFIPWQVVTISTDGRILE